MQIIIFFSVQDSKGSVNKLAEWHINRVISICVASPKVTKCSEIRRVNEPQGSGMKSPMVLLTNFANLCEYLLQRQDWSFEMYDLWCHRLIVHF